MPQVENEMLPRIHALCEKQSVVIEAMADSGVLPLEDANDLRTLVAASKVLLKDQDPDLDTVYTLMERVANTLDTISGPTP